MNLAPSGIVFLAAWVGSAFGGYLLFNRNFVSLAFKRRAWPLYVLLMAALFLAFGYGLNRQGLTFIAVPVFVIAWLNITRARFCPECASLSLPKLFSSEEFCRKCGASLATSSPKENSN